MSEGRDDSESAASGARADPLLLAVGERIRAARVAAGIGPVEAARRMDVKKGYWNRLERGLQNVSLRTLARVAAALGTTMGALVEGVDADGAGLDTRPYAWKAGRDVRPSPWRRTGGDQPGGDADPTAGN